MGEAGTKTSDVLSQALKTFRIVASEFAFIPDEDVTDEETGKVTSYGLRTYIDLFADEVSCKRFGKMYPKALAYLTAHKLKMLNVTEGGAEASSTSDGFGDMSLALRISSASEGETSVSFRDPYASGSTNPDSDYSLTVYGMEYLKIRRNCIIPIISSGEPVFLRHHIYPHTHDCLND